MSIEDEVASFEEFKKEAEVKYLRFQSSVRPDEADFEERYTKRLAREGADPNYRNTPLDTPTSLHHSKPSIDDRST